MFRFVDHHGDRTWRQGWRWHASVSGFFSWEQTTAHVYWVSSTAEIFNQLDAHCSNKAPTQNSPDVVVWTVLTSDDSSPESPERSPQVRVEGLVPSHRATDTVPSTGASGINLLDSPHPLACHGSFPKIKANMWRRRWVKPIWEKRIFRCDLKNGSTDCKSAVRSVEKKTVNMVLSLFLLKSKDFCRRDLCLLFFLTWLKRSNMISSVCVYLVPEQMTINFILS